jgi:hypothetical protein
MTRGIRLDQSVLLLWQELIDLVHHILAVREKQVASRSTLSLAAASGLRRSTARRRLRCAPRLSNRPPCRRRVEDTGRGLRTVCGGRGWEAGRPDATFQSWTRAAPSR